MLHSSGDASLLRFKQTICPSQLLAWQALFILNTAEYTEQLNLLRHLLSVRLLGKDYLIKQSSFIINSTAKPTPVLVSARQIKHAASCFDSPQLTALQQQQLASCYLQSQSASSLQPIELQASRQLTELLSRCQLLLEALSDEQLLSMQFNDSLKISAGAKKWRKFRRDPWLFIKDAIKNRSKR